MTATEKRHGKIRRATDAFDRMHRHNYCRDCRSWDQAFFGWLSTKA